MKKILYAFIVLMTFTSCAKSYYIQGSSNISNLDGRKLYLKGGSADTLITIDSCDVVHGEFAFRGTLDSVQIVQVYMDDMNLQFPLVLEEGNIHPKTRQYTAECERHTAERQAQCLLEEVHTVAQSVC